MGISEILSALDIEISQLQRARAFLGVAVEPMKKPGRPKKSAITPASTKPNKKRRNLTPEGRKRIAEAVKRRWAAQKKAAAAE
jgi:hypothetical protein